MDTPVGSLVLVVRVDDAKRVIRCDFARPDDPAGQPPSWRGLAVRWDRPWFADFAAQQIQEYFEHRRRVFDLDLQPLGTGNFDRLVWRNLPELVPFGSTISYGEIARRLGKPKAARAVGRANATNPISLIVPCHRVIGADRRLVGYGGGQGVSTKRKLLEHEARECSGASSF